ncbi:MAG: NUDIX domain-containing protein [Alphaproteobacteria bacterium]|nr:NUDIX domain-containing protein [Alphaproteobacteria bacterium]
MPKPFSRADVKTIERTTPFRGFFSLDLLRLKHRNFAGGWSPPIEREVFMRDNAAGLLPYDPALDRVALVEQFRAGVFAEGSQPPWTLEVVAGIIKPSESAEAVARREAEEEAGATVRAIEHICDFFVSPGGCSEYVMLYCGRCDLSGLTTGDAAGLAHEHEDIRLHVLGFEDALAAMKAGRTNNAITIIALQWLAMNRERLRKVWS